MKSLGIIAEYNPFHNGHKYHIEKSREITGAECVVAVMSGNFTQRGETAILNKWERSKLAVENGADLVLELPFLYACNRAEHFARGAVDILAGIGVDYISFGSESGNIEQLKNLVEQLIDSETQLAEIRAAKMKEGLSYAKANEIAVASVIGQEEAGLILEPNNILAIEYLKRLAWLGEENKVPKAVTVKRHGSGFFGINAESGFAGASAIRKMVGEEVSDYVPKNVGEALKNANKEAEEHFFELVRSELVKRSNIDLSGIYCVGEGIENKFKKEIISAESMEQLISSMVSKRYTEAAIRRILVYILLGVGDEEVMGPVYGRVLAANEVGRKFMKHTKKNELNKIPFITNLNKEDNLSNEIKRLLEFDTLASDMYSLINKKSLYDNSDRVVMPYMK